MLRTSGEHLLWELEHLARYAEKGGSARGRRFPEPEHPFRTPFERDRDRIIHSRSFRRLEAKTQVFVKRPGQPYRTRLTHTLEVTQISRTAAHALRLNEDLTEAIALAHDLGHPPFGHAGERVLNELGKDVGGFDHNRQSLRIVDLLESRYAAFPGLNLTWEVREGLGKHGSGREAMPGLFGDWPQPSLEAQVVDVCDEVAYNNHDVDDGLASGLLSLPQVLESLPLWRSAWEEVAESWPHAPDSLRISETVRTLIDRQTTDIMNVTLERLKRHRTINPDDARKRPNPTVNFSSEMAAIHQQQREFLFTSLYRHPEVNAANDEAVEALRVLFQAYQSGKMTLDPPLSEEEAGEPYERRIIDALACMTDDQALFLSQGSLTDPDDNFGRK
jgi:dGTPase